MLVALVLGMVAAVMTLRERPAVHVRGGPAAVSSALSRWSTVENPARAHVTFDSMPTADVREWLAALPPAGTAVSWDGASLAPAAIALEPVVDPKRPLRVWVAAPQNDDVAVRDSVGLIDSVRARSGGALLTVADAEGVVRAVVRGTIASDVRRDSIVVRPVLVLGVASWEGKFIMASLEEHGWRVDARFALAPTGDVVQGVPAAVGEARIDTSRYAAVIALDTSAVKYAGRIGEYVRRGGGFIASGGAAALPAFASLLPASTSPTRPDSPFDIDSTRPRRALALAPLVRLTRDAVAMEMIDDRVAVAARRVGRGRVLQVGYLDTWRWRMGGLSGSGSADGRASEPVRDYRAWWSAMVSSVAYAPRIELAGSGARGEGTDATPLASLVGTLGVATPLQAEGDRSQSFGAQMYETLSDPRLLTALFAVILGALLVETASRRLRGKP